MAKRHLAGMRPASSSNVVKFHSDEDERTAMRPQTSGSPRRTTSNAWHDVMEMCRKVFTTKMNSVGSEILQDVRTEMQRGMTALREEIFNMLQEREKSSSSQIHSLMQNIDKLRQSTEEGVMNIQFDLSPAIQEMQRLEEKQVEARRLLEEKVEKVSQQLAQVQVRADLEEEKLQRVDAKQDHAESLLAGVQRSQDMLAVSLESASDEAARHRAKAAEENAELVKLSHHLGRQFHQRLQEPVHVDFGEVLREVKKTHSAVSSDFRMVLGEIGKIQQALHLDFIQMAEYVAQQERSRSPAKDYDEPVSHTSLPPAAEAPAPTAAAVVAVQSAVLGSPMGMEKAHPSTPRKSVRHCATSPGLADKGPNPLGTESENGSSLGLSEGLPFTSAKRGATLPGGLVAVTSNPNAISRGRLKRVREFWCQTEPPPVEETAMQTDPVKFENKKGKRIPIPEPKKSTKPAKKEARVFQDAEAMKQKARQDRVKPQYNVFDYYHKKGCAQYIAKHWLLEYITLAVVCLNTLWIAIDTDNNKASIITNASIEFQIAENFFCGYFFCELLIRFLAFQSKRYCFQDYWFNFDLLLVVLMVAETWIVPLVFNLLRFNEEDLANAVNIDFLRILRLVRILRLSRMAKLLRAVPELVIIIKGIGFAARSVIVFFLLWTMIIYVFAIVLRQTTDGFDFGSKYFNSTTNAMATLFLSGIVPGQASLVEEAGFAHWAFWLILVSFVLLASVTIMYMLVGVLVEVMTVISATEKEGMTVSYVASTLRGIMHHLNYSTEVPLSQREFQQLLLEEDVDRLLRGIGVDVVALVDTADVIYEDFNKFGMSMTFENLVETILNLRGKNTATVKDVKEQSRVIKSVVQQTLQANGSKVMEEFQYLRAELALLREEALRRDEDDEDEDYNLLPVETAEVEVQDVQFPRVDEVDEATEEAPERTRRSSTGTSASWIIHFPLAKRRKGFTCETWSTELKLQSTRKHGQV